MAPAALMIHLGCCIRSIHFSEFQQGKTLIKVLDNDLSEVTDEEFFPLETALQIRLAIGKRDLPWDPL